MSEVLVWDHRVPWREGYTKSVNSEFLNPGGCSTYTSSSSSPFRNALSHIHLIYFEVVMCFKFQKHPYGLKSSNWCICFIIVYSLFLRVTFFHQSCFVPHHDAIFIQFVPEYPFRTNYWLVLSSGYQFP